MKHVVAGRLLLSADWAKSGTFNTGGGGLIRTVLVSAHIARANDSKAFVLVLGPLMVSVGVLNPL